MHNNYVLICSGIKSNASYGLKMSTNLYGAARLLLKYADETTALYGLQSVRAF